MLRSITILLYNISICPEGNNEYKIFKYMLHYKKLQYNVAIVMIENRGDIMVQVKLVKLQ